MEVWTGFLVGLAGSLHCVGMCGPIVLALPSSEKSRLKIFLGRILYNAGRIVTYALMGALFGLFGSRIILFTLQQNLSIAIGLLIIIYILTPKKIKNKLSGSIFYKKIFSLLESNFTNLFSRRSSTSLFAVGLLNGLLPCGFVYMGIAGAVSTGGWLNGFFYMFLFGLGTLPVMLAAAYLGRVINLNLRRRISKIIPYLTLLLALLFILRGLNLGIPFVSPKFSPPSAQVPACH